MATLLQHLVSPGDTDVSWDTSDRRSRLPTDWPARVAAVKKRDGYRCTWIDGKRRCIGPADEVDHRRRGDDHRLSNLRSLCTPHHRAKTTSEALAARGVGPARKRPVERHPGLVEGGG